MSLKRVVARNVLANYAGMVVTMAAGFVTAPFLASRLGDTGYGLWLLIGAFTGYIGLLDLGVRGSVGRFIAFHHARNDQQAMNETATTAMALLCAPALVSIAATFGAVFFFFSLFDVPPEQAESVRIALLIAGVNLALTFPLSVYDGILWAHQRFDFLNVVDVVLVVFRTTFVFYLIGQGHGLIALSAITLASTVFCAPIKAFMAYRVNPVMRIRPRYLRWNRLGALFGYSLWYLVVSAGQMFTSQLSRILVGSWLGVAFVTPFDFAGSLIRYGAALLVSCTGVLTPVATAYHSGEQHDKQQQLFLSGGRFCSYFGFCFIGGCLFLGHPFLRLWVPLHADTAFSVLTIMVVGEGLAMSQSITWSIILGAGKHRSVAFMTILEAVIVFVATKMLFVGMGLRGAAIAVAAGGILCRCVLRLWYGCQMLDCPYRHYLRYSLLTPLAHAAVPGGLLAMTTWWKVPGNWLEFGVFSAVYAVVCAALGINLMHLWTRKEGILSLVRPTSDAVPNDA
jgi:O-antigen/teichoic acid export membrane protein